MVSSITRVSGCCSAGAQDRSVPGKRSRQTCFPKTSLVMASSECSLSEAVSAFREMYGRMHVPIGQNPPFPFVVAMKSFYFFPYYGSLHNLPRPAACKKCSYIFSHEITNRHSDAFMIPYTEKKRKYGRGFLEFQIFILKCLYLMELKRPHPCQRKRPHFRGVYIFYETELFACKYSL